MDHKVWVVTKLIDRSNCRLRSAFTTQYSSPSDAAGSERLHDLNTGDVITEKDVEIKLCAVPGRYHVSQQASVYVEL